MFTDFCGPEDLTTSEDDEPVGGDDPVGDEPADDEPTDDTTTDTTTDTDGTKLWKM